MWPQSEAPTHGGERSLGPCCCEYERVGEWGGRGTERSLQMSRWSHLQLNSSDSSWTNLLCFGGFFVFFLALNYTVATGSLPPSSLRLKINHETGWACDVRARCFYLFAQRRVVWPSPVGTGCFYRGALVSADPMTRWVSGCDAEAGRAPSVCGSATHGINTPERRIKEAGSQGGRGTS